MYETTPYVELMFQATVPIPCPGCSLTVPVVRHVGLTVSSCSLTFTAADANSTQQILRIRAVQTAGRNARILSLKFGSIVATGSPWHGLTLQPILVYYNLHATFALFIVLIFQIMWQNFKFKFPCNFCYCSISSLTQSRWFYCFIYVTCMWRSYLAIYSLFHCFQHISAPSCKLTACFLRFI